jgi:hypothetical protein
LEVIGHDQIARYWIECAEAWACVLFPSIRSSKRCRETASEPSPVLPLAADCCHHTTTASGDFLPVAQSPANDRFRTQCCGSNSAHAEWLAMVERRAYLIAAEVREAAAILVTSRACPRGTLAPLDEPDVDRAEFPWLC